MESTHNAMWENTAGTLGSMQASLLIILQNWPLFLHLLTLQFAFAVLISNILAKIIVDKDLAVVISFIGGILGATLFSLCLAVLKIKPSPVLGMVVYSFALIIIIWRREQINISVSFLKIIAFFLFILLLRLIFVQNLLVPSYADSVTHLQIVRDLMSPEDPPQAFFYLSFDANHYYHFGFHALSAWLNGITSTDPIHVILILGQYFQALAVLAIYPLVMVLSRSSVSAWTAMCISGLLLPTPSYASNWGKYPAIASMVGIVFVLTLWLVQMRFKPSPSVKFRWLTGLAILSTACIHSRSIFALAAVVLSFYLCTKMELLRRKKLASGHDRGGDETLAFSLVVATMISIIVVWEIGFSIWIFLALILFFVFAFYLDFFMAAFIAVLIIVASIGYFVPTEWISLSARFDTIFDRPFLIIFFYIPASIFIWLGLEGVVTILFTEVNRILLQRWLLAGTITFGVINAIFLQNHHPSECCVFLNDDDLFSFAWMQNNIPDNSIVGIAASGKPGNYLPIDGGAWIEYLTGIPTRRLDSKIDFYFEVENLCKEGVTYVYLDNLENSFDEYGLVEINSDYRFGLGDVRIYQLPCDDISINRKFP